MINVSTQLKSACKSPQNTHREYIVIGNQTIDISGKLNATAYKDTTFFGTFNMKTLEFETPNDINYRNKEFTYYKQINNEAFKIGKFIVTEIKDNDSEESVSVTANDYGLKFAVPYTTELDYGSGEITLYDVLEECCEKAGVELENTSITNGDFIVEDNQFVNGELIGDVICGICMSSGDFATINDNDKLELIFTNETDEIIEDYVELEDKRDTQPITSVSVGSSQVEGQEAILRDEELIEEYGEHWLIINDNPFAYTLEKRQELVTAIFNKVKGFAYSSFKSEYAYLPYLTLGDLIQFKNKNGDLINSIILRYTMEYEDCTFEAPSITSSTIDYEKSPRPEERAKRAEIIANQANANITAIVQSQDELEQRVNQTELSITEQDVKIEILSTNIDEENGNITSVTTSSGFTFNNDGLDISSGEEGFNTLINNTGTYYKDGDTIISQTTKDNIITKDMVLYGKYYYGVDENLDVSNFTKEDAMFLGQKYTDGNGNDAFGHFYNGEL